MTCPVCRTLKDKDLPAGSMMVATVLSAEHLETAPASRIGALLKQLRMEQAEPCDMVILCVAPGRGKPFVQGLRCKGCGRLGFYDAKLGGCCSRKCMLQAESAATLKARA